MLVIIFEVGVHVEIVKLRPLQIQETGIHNVERV
jgi:hypothetical protein